MFWGPPRTPAPRSALAIQPWLAAIHDLWSSSKPALDSTASPQRWSAGRSCCGVVPSRNSSLTRLPPTAARPVHGSTAASTSESGFRKPLIDQPSVASWRKPCQTWAVTSIESSGSLGVEMRVLSELPFQAATASAYSPSARSLALGAPM